MSRRIRVYAAAALVVGSAAAMEKPRLSSPGATDEALLIAESCPTFHWGLVAGTSDFELVVYQVDQPSAEPILRQRLPGSVVAWAPSLDRCLTPGGTFAWSIRAKGADAESGWSEPNLFRVANPAQVQLVDAEGERQRLDASSELGTGSAAELHGEVLAADDLPRQIPRSQPEAGGSSTAEGAVAVGDEPLRLIRGIVSSDGSVLYGEGFTVSHNGTGSYTITWVTPFPPGDIPATVVSPFLGQVGSGAGLASLGTSSAMISTWDAANNPTDSTFVIVVAGR